MAIDTLRWWADAGIIAQLLCARDNREFQRLRRIIADREAKGNYILSDDDCRLLDSEMIDVGMGALESHPDFGILSAWPANATIHPWTAEDGYKPFSDSEVMEHHDVGGIRFCRKGCLREWPQLERGTPGYDAIHCAALRATGYRVGYLRNVRMNHLGEGSSTIWLAS